MTVREAKWTSVQVDGRITYAIINAESEGPIDIAHGDEPAVYNDPEEARAKYEERQGADGEPALALVKLRAELLDQPDPEFKDEEVEISEENTPDVPEGEEWMGTGDRWLREYHHESLRMGVAIQKYDDDSPWSVSTHSFNTMRGMMDLHDSWNLYSFDDAVEKAQQILDAMVEQGADHECAEPKE